MSDVFISYAHDDERLVERLRAALSARERDVWIDTEGIEPADRWRLSALEAIERSDAFVFVLSRHSLASTACVGELEHAVSLNKRVIAICVEASAKDVAKPEILDELSWIMMRPEDDFGTGIDRLVHALDTDLEVARTHTRILVRAKAWELAGRRASPLLRGEDLVDAEEWMSLAALSGGPQPTDLQREFIRASRQAATRRRRIGLGIASSVTLLAIVLSVIAVSQHDQAAASQKTATSRRLAAEAESTLASDASLGTLLALKALSVRFTPQAEQALRDALGQLQTLDVLRGHTGPVHSAAFSPAGSEIVTASDDGTARIWSVRSGAQLGVLRSPDGALTSAVFSPNGSEILTASMAGTARIYSARSGAQLAVFDDSPSELTDAGFSPDGSKIVISSADGAARIWDVRRGSLLAALNPHAGAVETAAFSPDGSRVVTADAGGPALVWDVRSGARLLTLPAFRQGSRFDAAAYSANGTRIAGALNDGAAVWDARTGARLAVIEDSYIPILSVAFSPDGSRVVTGGSDGAVRIWSASSGAQLSALNGGVSGAASVQYSPDGARIVTAGGDPTARIWNARSGSVLSVLPEPVSQLAAAFSPDGARVVTASADRKARVWDAHTAALKLTLTGHRGIVDSVVFSPDGSKVATASLDGSVRVWDAHNGAQLLIVRPTPITYGEPAVHSVAFSPDGATILGATLNGAWLWNASTGALLKTYQPGEGVERAAFNSDGSRIVTAGLEGGVRVWGTSSGADLLTINSHTGPVNSAEFSRDGSKIVSAGEDGTARIWSTSSGAQLLSLSSGHQAVSYASFSPDGSQVLTAGQDGTARIWDAHSGTQSLVLNGAQLFLFKRLPYDGIADARFSPNGSRIATASEDGMTLIWSTELMDPLRPLERMARSLVTRPFTHQEQQTYLAGIGG